MHLRRVPQNQRPLPSRHSPGNELKEAIGKLYNWGKFDETTQIPKNLVEEVLNYIYNDKKKPSFLKKIQKKKKLIGDRRTILTSFKVEGKPIEPNKRRVEISTPFGGKVK